MKKKHIKQCPSVSFLIPTFNAEAYIDKCLVSIQKLDYPHSQIEVIVADGGSTDATLEIVKNYKVTIVSNHRKTAEYGKKIAYSHSSGEYVVFLDADNVIASKTWLKEMIVPFDEAEVIGVESNYLLADDFGSINKYANLLVIVDPLARYLASKPKIYGHKNGYVLKHYKKGSIPVTGANGFIWRRSVIDMFDRNDELNEVSMMSDIAVGQDVVIANVPRLGIYHYYCDNLSDYIKKRMKIANKHIQRESRVGTTWVKRKGLLRLALGILYLSTIVGPCIEAVKNIIKTRQISWLWHPVISLITVYTYAGVFIKRKMLS